jgi:hypothetical protein
VQIDPDVKTYYNPRIGEPARMGFTDRRSKLENRLFGAGAAMQVDSYVVSSEPAP